MVDFWNLVVNMGITIVGPCMAVAVLLQNSVAKASSVKDKKEASIMVKILGLLMLYGICFWDFGMYKETWNFMMDVPNAVSKGGNFGAIAFAFIVMWASFYYIIFLMKGREIVFYRYKSIRWIVIGAQVADSIMMIVFLCMINAKKEINNAYWHIELLLNFILMVLFIIVDAIRLGYEKSGAFFEYNTIFLQKKIFKISEKKIEIHIENNGYIVTNGTEEVRLDRLTPYQESGIKKIMDLIKG